MNLHVYTCILRKYITWRKIYSCYSRLKPHCPKNETSSVSYVTPRYTGTRQDLNEKCFNNSVCLASFVLIAHHSFPKEKCSFVIIVFWSVKTPFQRLSKLHINLLTAFADLNRRMNLVLVHMFITQNFFTRHLYLPHLQAPLAGDL